jgi:hypothetical protein
MNRNSIARVVGASDETIAKYFTDELLTGRDRRRAELLRLLWAAARRGNISAIKRLLDMTDVQLRSEQPPAKLADIGRKLNRITSGQRASA